MASVTLNNDMRRNIVGKACESFQKRRDELQEIHNKKMDELRQDHGRLFDLLIKSYGLTREQYDSIPEGWHGTRSDVTIVNMNGIRVMWRVTLPQKIKVPGTGSYGVYEFNLNDPTLDEYEASARALWGKLEEIQKEQSVFATHLRNLLDQCRTLKQALEAYPALERWVPADLMERHRAPSSRKEQAKKIREKVDLTAITMALLKEHVNS